MIKEKSLVFSITHMLSVASTHCDFLTTGHQSFLPVNMWIGMGFTDTYGTEGTAPIMDHELLCDYGVPVINDFMALQMQTPQPATQQQPPPPPPPLHVVDSRIDRPKLHKPNRYNPTQRGRRSGETARGNLYNGRGKSTKEGT